MAFIDDITKELSVFDTERFCIASKVLAQHMSNQPYDIKDMRILSDNHLKGCHCEVCDWVETYDWENLILHPVEVPECVY